MCLSNTEQATLSVRNTVKPRKKTFVASVALVLLLLGWATLSGGGRIYIGYSGRWTGFSRGHYYRPDALGENTLKCRFVIFGPVRVDHFEPETRIIEPPTEASVVGAYLHTNRDLTDKIVLEPGGRFYQEVTYADGRVWSMTNSWSLTDLTLRLDECYETYDWEKSVESRRPPRGYFPDDSDRKRFLSTSREACRVKASRDTGKWRWHEAEDRRPLSHRLVVSSSGVPSRAHLAALFSFLLSAFSLSAFPERPNPVNPINPV